jgi:S1-C subfamily serine protease
MASTTPIPDFKSVSFLDAGAVKLGQTAIALGGQTGKEVQRGLISDIETTDATSTDANGNEATTTIVDHFKTNIAFTAGSAGGPLITLGGNVAGVNVQTDNGWIVIPSDTITKTIASLTGVVLGDTGTTTEPINGLKKLTEVLSNLTGGAKDQ